MTDALPGNPDAYADRLQAFLEERSVQGELLRFTQSTHSVAEACEATGARPEDFVKNICLITTEGSLVVAIVKGEDRVNYDLVARAAGTRRVHPASPAEILAMTGFPCGGTPSFGFPARVIVDPRVMEMETVYTGGGSEQALMRVSPAEILRHSGASIIPIRKG
jgi:prolyl-tRNA editing enzyme YbaK/EbsC (Cys-tRNA(Pro) deacylase)